MIEIRKKIIKIIVYSGLVFGCFLLYEQNIQRKIHPEKPIIEFTSDNIYSDLILLNQSFKQAEPRKISDNILKLINNKNSQLFLGKDGYNQLIGESCFYSVINGDISEANKLARTENIRQLNPYFSLISLFNEMKNRNWQEFDQLFEAFEKNFSSNLRNEYGIFPLIRAWVEFDKGKKEEAIILLEKLAKEQHYSELLLQLALMYKLNGDIEKAKIYFDKTSKSFLDSDILAREDINTDLLRASRKITNLVITEFYEANNFIKNKDRNNLPNEIPDANEFAKNLVNLKQKSQSFIRNSEDAISLYMFDVAAALMIAQSPRMRKEDFPLYLLQLANYISENDLCKIGLAILHKSLELHEACVEDLASMKTKEKVFRGLKNDILAENYFKIDDYNRAQDVILEQISLFPNMPENYLMLAEIYMLEKNYLKAEKFYSRALDVVKNFNQESLWYIYLIRGEFFSRIGNYPQAELDYEEALKLNPKSSSAMNNLAYHWLESNKNLDKAINLLLEAHLINDKDSAIMDSLALAYYLKSDYHEALRYAELAIIGLPGDFIVNEHLGDIYEKLGEKNAAFYQWKYALESGSKDIISLERVKKKIENYL